MILMKKRISLLVLSVLSILLSHGVTAQTGGGRKFMANIPKGHFFSITYGMMFMDDDYGVVDEKWSLNMRLSYDHYFNDTFFVGSGFGLSMPSLKSKISLGGSQPYYSYTNMYNLEIPLFAGLNLGGNLLRVETGPALGIALAGETEVTYLGKTQSTMKLKDMEDVDRVYLSWMVNAYICHIVKIGFGVALTDTPLGEDVGVSCLQLGISF